MIDRALCLRAASECVCLNLRKASRRVTQLYDEALSPLNLRCTQLTILLAVQMSEPAAPSQLAEELVMDRSTLTRNLQPLLRSGLLTIKPGADRRSRQVTLTPAGHDLLEAALAKWQAVQTRFLKQFGKDRWQTMLTQLAATVDAAQKADDPCQA